MTTFTPPYADPGRAAYEELDSYLQSYLLAGSHPELKPSVSFPLAINTTLAQFSVVGLNASGNLTLATYGQAAAAASIALTFSGTGTADDTVTVAGVVYTLKAVPGAANEIDIGADAAGTAANFAAAINAGAGIGTAYGTGTVANPVVSASVAGAVVTLTARQVGAAGNTIPVAEAGTGASFAGGATALAGGRDVSGIRPIGILAHAASLGGSGTANGQVWYSGCFNVNSNSPLVWHASFDTEAKKMAAFNGAPSPTTIIIAKRVA